MRPDRASFMALNIPTDDIPEFLDSFVISALPNTDLWRKPPSQDTSTAPILYTTMRFPFTCAEVTVSADWELEWDQAGLVIFAGDPALCSTLRGSATPEGQPPGYVPPAQASKWAKVGLELCNGTYQASSVCANSEGADQAYMALPPHQARNSELRLKLERLGTSLWIWFEDPLAGWKKIRDVTWFFWNVENKDVRVGVYASRPANFPNSRSDSSQGQARRTTRELRVQFDELAIF